MSLDCRCELGVREETNHSRFVSLPLLPSHLLMLKICQDMRCQLTHPHNTQLLLTSLTWSAPSLPPSHATASRSWCFDTVRATTSLTPNSELEWFYGILMQSAPPLPPSNVTMSLRWYLYGVKTPFVPPQTTAFLGGSFWHFGAIH